jgi:SAM-dependent methyltransferase
MNMPLSGEPSDDAVAKYVPPADEGGLWRGEERLLAEIVHPGVRALDLGAGTGRVTRALLDRGASVVACDLSESALDVLRRRCAGRGRLETHVADIRRLPFPDAAFDVVLLMFNVLDFVIAPSERVEAIREAGRVVRPGGSVIMSSQNPVGMLLTPRGIWSWRSWRHRFRLVMSGDLRNPTFVNADGLELAHRRFGHVRHEVESCTLLRLDAVTSVSGIGGGLARLVSAYPYYRFRRLMG